MHKKGFTVLEILLVVLILGIIITSVSNFFKPANRNVIYSEICINKIYGSVHNYLNKAITGKGIARLSGSNGVIIYPDTYMIQFDYTDNQIHFGYTKGNSSARHEHLNLSGNRAPENCHTSSYQVVLSGNVDQVSIRKNLQENINTPGFVISGTNTYTGQLLFVLEENGRTTPQHKYTIDTRTQTMNHITCLRRDPTRGCYKRKD